MVAPLVALQIASTAAKGVGGLLNRGAQRKAERRKQQLRDEYTGLQGREFDFRDITRRTGLTEQADLARQGFNQNDALVREGVTSLVNIGTQRAQNADATARQNMAAGEGAALTQIGNARTRREQSLAASGAATAEQMQYQDVADALARAFMGQTGRPQNDADRQSAFARREATTDAAISAAGGPNYSPIADDVVRGEFDRKITEGRTRSRSEARAGNRVAAYGDAGADAAIRSARFGQDVQQLGIKADYAAATLPSKLAAIQAEADAGDANAQGALSILTAFNDGMGAAQDRRLDTEQGIVGQNVDDRIGTNANRTNRLIDASAGYVQGANTASQAYESSMGDITDARISGTRGTNKLGDFLTTAGEIGSAVSSIGKSIPENKLPMFLRTFDKQRALTEIAAAGRYSMPSTFITPTITMPRI